MHIIILGGGKVGESLARNLANEENDIVVVDLDFNHLEFLKSHLDIQTVHGSASNPSALLKAGIEDSDLIIAVTSNDDANMLSCLIATKLFKIPRTIARIRGHDYHQYPELYKNKNIPIQTVIYPTGLLINHISRMIQYPDFSQISSFFNDKIFLVALDTHEEDWFHGKTIAEINHKLSKSAMKLIALLHQKNAVPLLEDYVVQMKDKLLFLGEEKKLLNLLKDLERKPSSAQRIMIAGGGSLGFGLAKTLENKYKIKLIEKDPKLAIKNGEELTKTIVLTGDTTDRELLVSENIEDIDVFCALTNHDEANIMSSLQAKYLGAKYAMSLVNRDSFIELIDDSLIDVAVSPQFITVTHILSTIKHDNVLKIHRFHENEAIAIEVLVEGNTKSSPLIGRPLVEIEWPQECMVAGLIRKKKLHFVTPKLRLANNDHLILIVWKKKYIHQVEAFFDVNLTFMS